MEQMRLHENFPGLRRTVHELPSWIIRRERAGVLVTLFMEDGWLFEGMRGHGLEEKISRGVESGIKEAYLLRTGVVKGGRSDRHLASCIHSSETLSLSHLHSGLLARPVFFIGEEEGNDIKNDEMADYGGDDC